MTTFSHCHMIFEQLLHVKQSQQNDLFLLNIGSYCLQLIYVKFAQLCKKKIQILR